MIGACCFVHCVPVRISLVAVRSGRVNNGVRGGYYIRATFIMVLLGFYYPPTHAPPRTYPSLNGRVDRTTRSRPK